jgi:hypothetical protein
VHLSNEKNREFVDAGDVLLRYVRAANVAAVTAAIRRRVLPLVYDKALSPSGVVEEERGHGAPRGRITGGSEVSVDEGTRMAISVRHGSPVAVSIKRCLSGT